MNKYIKSLAITLIAAGGFATTASADEIKITYTGDNIIFNGLCHDQSCMSVDYLPIGPNLANWRKADTTTLDLGRGEYWLLFEVINFGNYTSRNPAALLAEIMWDGHKTNSSSSHWEVSTDRINWTSATEFGANGGANIWTSVNGGNPVGGISENANWIWTDNQSTYAFIRTSVKVPEPGSLALLGLGLAGLGFSRRRARQ